MEHPIKMDDLGYHYFWKHPNLLIARCDIQWDLTNGPRSVSCDRAIRYSGFFGVQSVGPVGDFLEFLGMQHVNSILAYFKRRMMTTI